MPRGRPRGSTAAKSAPRKTTTARALPEFSQSLVLNQWLFGLFGLESTDGFYPIKSKPVALLEAFKERFHINETTEEGLDENNVHRFHHAIVNQITGPLPGLTEADLLGFDQNIVHHTLALNAERVRRRERPIVWKYYQYLALLFVEIYLERFFRDASALAMAINAHIKRFNHGKDAAAQLPLLDEGANASLGLNKLALWCATGSGKTLLMHVNLRQYQHYLDKAGRAGELNRVILLTPNEGLSNQHLREFAAAGIEAELFNKNGRGLFAGRSVEIIEVSKLAEESKVKTVAVDAFENSNLVLVDEGHRGMSGGSDGVWLTRRDQLCEKGFSFEYSATFKQAVKGDATLAWRYARSIVFDYSYRYFYGDGYGKDYQILNLDDDTQQNQLDKYMTACLLAAYQQRRLFDEKQSALAPFQLEQPLWIFVGGSVNAVRKQSGRDVSDVTEILLFLSRFVANRTQSMSTLRDLLDTGLLTADGKNLFSNRFTYLIEEKLSPDALFADICGRLFNAPGGGSLHVEMLKGSDGELAVKLGNNEAFGVINVGDARKLYELCDRTPGIIAEERDFSGSLFRRLDERDNRISLLIGSRKFTEGWNSWRVSTLGLMKIGQSEGAQIIQLFGRGVRLKGYQFSLKRSKALNLPSEVVKPKYIELLETLNVFGVRADYMAQFKQYLEEEGLAPDQEREEIVLPVVRNLGVHKLKMIRLKQEINGVQTTFGTAFRQLAPVPELAPPTGENDHWLLKNKVILNWYPKIQALKAQQLAGGDGDGPLDYGKLSARHVALLDLDRAWFELLRYKNERGWHNFNMPRAAMALLLADRDWYELLIPETELVVDDLRKLPVWQEIAEVLLKKYAERYYKFRKKGWEEPHLEYAELDINDPTLHDANFPDPGDGVAEEQGVYRVSVEKSETALIAQLKAMRDEFRAGQDGPWTFQGGGSAVRFKEHLYEPLIKVSGATIQMKPVSLNDGEMRFVTDLKTYCAAHPNEFVDKPLFLLRNMSRGRGVGFFEAGNFYPDFILWRVDGGKQHITFVDPKGIRNLPWNDPKLTFGETIKEIEQRMGDGNVELASFIVSNTPASEMALHWNKTLAEMAARHIVFQENAPAYIRVLLK